MDWIDAHCHLSDPRADAETCLRECAAAGITRFVLGGVDPEDWDRQQRLAQAHPGRFFTVFGLHPWRVHELAALPGAEAALGERLAELQRRLPGASAVGETGLDAARDRFKSSEGLQRAAFARQLGLARRAGKPAVLHVVRAHAPALELLGAEGPLPRGGLIHSFSGTWADARRYLDLGWTLSVSARVTFPDARDLHETVKKAPPGRLVFETDAPDQPPHGAAGRLHTPLSLLKVVQAAAELRSEKPETLMSRSRDALLALFGKPAEPADPTRNHAN